MSPVRSPIRSPIRHAVFLCVIVILGAACGGGGGSTARDSRPKSSATIAITDPAPGSTVARSVLVTMKLDGGVLVPANQTGGALRGGEGHVHVLVDGELVAMPATLTNRLPVLRPGTHTVQVEYVATDHAPFADPIVAAVTFTVR